MIREHRVEERTTATEVPAVGPVNTATPPRPWALPQHQWTSQHLERPTPAPSPPPPPRPRLPPIGNRRLGYVELPQPVLPDIAAPLPAPCSRRSTSAPHPTHPHHDPARNPRMLRGHRQCAHPLAAPAGPNWVPATRLRPDGTRNRHPSADNRLLQILQFEAPKKLFADPLPLRSQFLIRLSTLAIRVTLPPAPRGQQQPLAEFVNAALTPSAPATTH